MQKNFVLGLLFLSVSQAFAAQPAAQPLVDYDVECGRQISEHVAKYQPESLPKIKNMRKVGPYLVSDGPANELIVQTAKRSVALKGANLNCTQQSAASVLPNALSIVLSKYHIPYTEVVQRANRGKDEKEKSEYLSLYSVIAYCRSSQDSWVQDVLKNVGFADPPGGNANPPGTAM